MLYYHKSFSKGVRPLTRQKRRRRRLNWTRLFVIITLVILLIAAGSISGLLAVSIRDMPAWSEESLSAANSSRMFDKDGNLITEIGVENRIKVEINQVPDIVKKAFLAAEDHQFYDHKGISPRGILRAAWNDILRREKAEGGSTITQQLVKLSFLTPEKTFKRKIQEIILAFKVERNYSKDEILEMYLNKIYLGEGAYGVQSASRTYFNKDIKDIDSLSEAATLAALPQAPSMLSPFQNYDAAKARRDLILDNMARYGFASNKQVEEAKNSEIALRDDGEERNNYPHPYFIDYITETLIKQYGEELVFKGGLQVYTTLDKNIQTAAENAMSNPNNFPSSQQDANGIRQPQGAMVVLDPKTGFIRAIVGGREHSHKRGLNRATMSVRQPGSAFKPIIAYAPAIEMKGLGPATVIDDIPVKYDSYGGYSPRNSDGSYRGLITMRTALAASVNIPAVKTLMDHVGIQNAISFASKLGIDLSPEHGPAVALGGLNRGVTPLQLAGAYGAFANQGLYNKPTAIIRVEAANGVVLDEYKPAPIQAMKPTTAFLVTDMLKSAVTSGTGTGANIGRPMAGKTGTADEGKDIWFAGYTPDLVGVVWIGYDDPTPMPTAYGGTYPARIWREVMGNAHRDIPSKDFRRPGGIVTATVDSKSGLLPGQNTPDEHVISDYFIEGTVPTQRDNVHVLVEICAESGKLPTNYCRDRVTRVMLKLPYDVPQNVGDYDIRVPRDTCDIHEPGNWVIPGNNGFGDDQEFDSDSDDEQNDNERSPGNNAGQYTRDDRR